MVGICANYSLILCIQSPTVGLLWLQSNLLTGNENTQVKIKEMKHNLGEICSTDITLNFVLRTDFTVNYDKKKKNGSLILSEGPSAAPKRSLLLFSQRGTGEQ